MKFQTLYIGTIVGWVLVVILEVLGTFFGAHQAKKANLPLQILNALLKHGRRTVLFTIAIANLLLLARKRQKNY